MLMSGGAVRDHSLLRLFSFSAYFDIKKDMLDSKVNKLVLWGYKETCLQVMRSEKQGVCLEKTCHIE